jgi:hypothetical protein
MGIDLMTMGLSFLTCVKWSYLGMISYNQGLSTEKLEVDELIEL